jgi:hypothetical protein
MYITGGTLVTRMTEITTVEMKKKEMKREMNKTNLNFKDLLEQIKTSVNENDTSYKELVNFIDELLEFAAEF